MKNKGFTLTEIIAVIVVLSILIVIAIPVYNGVTKNVKEKTLETKKNALQIAAIKYASENNVNSTIKITGTKLILDNYYKAESYIDNDKELPFIANPMDINDNLACHPITITLDNYEYNAVVEDSSDCSISKNEIDDSKIKVLAYEIGTNNLIGFENFNETKWTNKDVLLKVETDLDYELIDFTMFGDTTSTSNNTYEVRANLFLNQEVDITLRLKDKSIKSKKVIVKIDKEKPVVRDDIGYNNEPGKTSSAVLASDGLGSGILKVLYARADTYNGNKIEAELEYQTNKSVKAILDQNLKNGKEYYVWAHDKAGNESEKYTYTVNGILEKYKITYNGNGGNASKNEDFINQGNTITNIATASRSGYNFAGWWTQSSGGIEIKNGSTINDDITLFAHWNPIQYTLIINTNGGSYNGSTSQTTIMQNENTQYTLETPTRDGYIFDGWSKNGGTWNDNTYTFTQDTSVSANWKEEVSQYTLTYADNLNVSCTIYNKKADPNSEWGTLCGSNKYYKLTTCGGSSFKTYSGSCGYFYGWYTQPKCQGTEITQSSRANGDITVYACIRKEYCSYEKIYNNDEGNIIDHFVTTYHCDRVTSECSFYSCRRCVGTGSSCRYWSCPDSYCLSSGSITLNNNGCASGSYHTVRKANFTETTSYSCQDFNQTSSLSLYYK